MRDLQDQEVKDAKFKALCPFGCNHTDTTLAGRFQLNDVDPDAKVKKYSDSQYTESVAPDDKVEELGRDFFSDKAFFVPAKIEPDEEVLSAAVLSVLELQQNRPSLTRSM